MVLDEERRHSMRRKLSSKSRVVLNSEGTDPCCTQPISGGFQSKRVQIRPLAKARLAYAAIVLRPVL
jgi:hypothetical protein